MHDTKNVVGGLLGNTRHVGLEAFGSSPQAARQKAALRPGPAAEQHRPPNTSLWRVWARAPSRLERPPHGACKHRRHIHRRCHRRLQSERARHRVRNSPYARAPPAAPSTTAPPHSRGSNHGLLLLLPSLRLGGALITTSSPSRRSLRRFWQASAQDVVEPAVPWNSPNTKHSRWGLLQSSPRPILQGKAPVNPRVDPAPTELTPESTPLVSVDRPTHP